MEATQTRNETDAERVLYIEHDGVGLTHQVLAEALAEPGFPVHESKAFVRNMRAAGYVKPYNRGRADKRSAYLYRPDAALALGVLLRASDAGFVSQEVRKVLGLSIQKWRDADRPGSAGTVPRSPGALILAAYAEGHRNFAADLAFFRQPGKREPLIAARYRQEADGMTRGTNFAEETEGLEVGSSWTCPLDQIMAHLMRRKGAVH